MRPVESCHRALAVRLGQGERHVGEARRGGGHVLHDHVEVDLGGGDGLEDRRRLARLVRDADHGDLRLAAVVRDPRDDRLLHLLPFGQGRRVENPGPRPRAERRPHVHLDAEPAGVLHAPQVQHLGAGRRHLEHLLGGDAVDAASGGHDPRVGGEHAVDVGVDLADVRAERGGERDRGGVRGAAAQRRDVLRALAHALEAGDDRDVALGERRRDPAGRDVDDAGVAVLLGGEDARLAARERPRLDAEVVRRHREQCRADPLTGGQQHVELAGRRASG